MNNLEQMNQAMEYLESHLLESISYGDAARIAGCSEYHFRRMFSFLAGMPIGEYVRLRKLSLAAELLKQTDQKIIDIALLLGYETPEAFTKAFQQLHGTTPTMARREDTRLSILPPMTFQLTIKGGVKMEYRITEKEEFYIIGFKKRITLIYHGVNTQMNSLHEQLTPAIIGELKSWSDVEPHGILSVSTNFDERLGEGSELDQYLGVASSRPHSGQYESLYVKPYTWAVFTAVGTFPDALQNTWARIYSEWLPSTSYELCGGPEILWNESPDTTKPDCLSEIWIPVIKK